MKKDRKYENKLDFSDKMSYNTCIKVIDVVNQTTNNNATTLMEGNTMASKKKGQTLATLDENGNILKVDLPVKSKKKTKAKFTEYEKMSKARSPLYGAKITELYGQRNMSLFDEYVDWDDKLWYYGIDPNLPEPPEVAPYIGITTTSETRSAVHNYIDAVTLAGGIPVLINDVKHLDLVDGVLIPGGCDIDPKYYGEPITFAVGINKTRDKLEMAVAKKALEYDVPILGICRGHQVLTVADGGSLYQDIYKDRARTSTSSIKHKVGSHYAYFNKSSILIETIKGKRITVNSYHHQALKKLPKGWIVSIRSADGLVEGIEKPGHRWAVGVQYHPEMLAMRGVSNGSAHAWQLFSEFINAAAHP